MPSQNDALVDQIRRVLSDAGRVIRTLETQVEDLKAEVATLRRQLAESEASPR
jgi:hypothetical protein